MAGGAATDSEGPPSGGRRARVRLALGLACVAAVAGCQIGPTTQDIDEPSGRYLVEVVRATFPEKQKLAKRSRMEIAVRNVGRETVPNVAVTVNSFYYRKDADKVEDPRNKPIFSINAEPRGAETWYKETWALGALGPRQTKIFVWDVTAVAPRPYDIRWRVSAGLDGKARAILASGQPPMGRFTGIVSDEVPQTRVEDRTGRIISGGEPIRPRRP